MAHLSSNLKQRLKISSFAVPLLILIIYLSAYPLFMPLFLVIVAATISAALWEYYQIAEAKGVHPLTILGIGTTFAYILAIFLANLFPFAATFPYIVLGAFLALAFGYALLKGNSPLVTLAITSFGIIYITIPLSYILPITFFSATDALQDGRWWLLYLLLTAKLTDTGAFVVGKLLGKTPLAPLTSPRKTWEGALGGLAAGVATSVLFYFLVNHFFAHPPMKLSLIQSLWLGSAISLLAQFGDLAESLLKRDAGVKDSSYLPGLGGILDIVDSLIFALPFLYFFMVTQ
jgi:phosphatidate cytidylyltransferase